VAANIPKHDIGVFVWKNKETRKACLRATKACFVNFLSLNFQRGYALTIDAMPGK